MIMGNFAKFTGVENPVTLVRNFSSQRTVYLRESRKAKSSDFACSALQNKTSGSSQQACAT